jgi:hypothetical protein
MGKSKHAVCPRCGQERAMEANGARCRACGRADRAKKPKPPPPPETPKPEPQVMWPPEQQSWGRCRECAADVPLLIKGMTIHHKSGESQKWEGPGPRCAGSAQRPTQLVAPPPRRVQVQDQPVRVDDRKSTGWNEIPAGLPGLGKNRGN